MTAKQDESLGRRICRMRLQHGMTQERLADIANVSAQAVSKWENDQSYPDILLLPLLAKTFDVTVDELLGIESAAPVEAAVVETEPVPVVEPKPEPEPEPVPEPNPEPEPEPEPEPIPEPDPIPDSKTSLDTNGPATHIHLHITQKGREAVNLSVPLGVARLLSNVASYMPARLIDGVDLIGLAKNAEGIGKGTLVDIDDGNDRVHITLE